MNDTSTSLKEQKDHGTSVFPCGLYEIFEDEVWDGVSHHWHDEIEIIYFMEGDFTLEINMESFSIRRECFCFVNSGELHYIKPLTPCVESAVVFNPRILSFEHYDVAQTRLLQPLVKGALRLPCLIDSSHPAFARIKQEYLDIMKVFHQTGYFLSGDSSRCCWGSAATSAFGQVRQRGLSAASHRILLLAFCDHTDLPAAMPEAGGRGVMPSSPFRLACPTSGKPPTAQPYRTAFSPNLFSPFLFQLG